MHYQQVMNWDCHSRVQSESAWAYTCKRFIKVFVACFHALFWIYVTIHSSHWCSLNETFMNILDINRLRFFSSMLLVEDQELLRQQIWPLGGIHPRGNSSHCGSFNALAATGVPGARRISDLDRLVGSGWYFWLRKGKDSLGVSPPHDLRLPLGSARTVSSSVRGSVRGSLQHWILK